MKHITINSWSDLERNISRKNYRKWIFRGQANFDWTLESSLARTFREASKIRSSGSRLTREIDKLSHERVMIDRFRRHAHLYLKHLPETNDDLSWLSMMQHYGAPTRLLDFSFSPYIALYFALESGDGDAALYCINSQALVQEDQEYFSDRQNAIYGRIMEKHNDEPCLYSFEPTFSNERLLSQQGVLVATNSLSFTHEETLDGYRNREKEIIKYRIPANMRYSGIRLLHRMNIISSIIYPGLEGFCQSFKQQPVFGLEWQQRMGQEIPE
ncbi:hypothetical protein BTN99_13640 [Vibrio campbellii]|nr:hypothetical protein BTN99_13640 [Vibrio campbellii]